MGNYFHKENKSKEDKFMYADAMPFNAGGTLSSRLKQMTSRTVKKFMVPYEYAATENDTGNKNILLTGFRTIIDEQERKSENSIKLDWMDSETARQIASAFHENNGKKYAALLQVIEKTFANQFDLFRDLLNAEDKSALDIDGIFKVMNSQWLLQQQSSDEVDGKNNTASNSSIGVDNGFHDMDNQNSELANGDTKVLPQFEIICECPPNVQNALEPNLVTDPRINCQANL